MPPTSEAPVPTHTRKAKRAPVDTRRARPASDPDPLPGGNDASGGDVDDGGDDGAPLSAKERTLAWIVVVDTGGVPWGGAAIGNTKDFVSLAIPELTHTVSGAVYPPRWMQINKDSVRMVFQVDEVTACAVAVQRQSGPLTMWGTHEPSMTLLAAQLKRVDDPSDAVE